MKRAGQKSGDEGDGNGHEGVFYFEIKYIGVYLFLNRISSLNDTIVRGDSIS